MVHNVFLNFEDGVTRVITCAENEVVTDAAFRQRINVPMDCRDGVCGTCKCFCEKGDFELGVYLDEAMTEEERAAGYVLACQMTPRSDCVLHLSVSAEVCKTGTEKTGATVTSVTAASDTTFVLELKLDRPIAFLPGQYVNVSVPGSQQTRAYSFSSPPASTRASFLIRRLPNGLMNCYLSETAKPGDRLEIAGPMGVFYLRESPRPLVFLAGGTGLAPFLSMLEVIAETRPDTMITMYYAVSRDVDLVELDRLEWLRSRLPGLRLTTVVADAASQHARKGFVTDHLTAADLHDGAADVYLCGPPAMVEGVSAHLEKLGIVPAHFYFEKFNPANTKREAA